VAIADLGIKHLVASHLPLDGSVTVIPHWLWVHYTHNYHGAMGLFGNNQVLLVVLAAVVLLVLVVMLREAIASSVLAQIAFGIIAGGAVGNLIDRLAHGYVIDYISVRSFYIFNFADACITVGTVLLLVDSLHHRQAHG
jgi:signal peptidase II